MTRSRLGWRVLIAFVSGGVVGATVGESATIAGVPLQAIFDLFGTLFVSALKMLVVPLVCSSVIVGAAGIGTSGRVGRLCLRTVSLFVLTSISAVVLGMVLVNVAAPGIVDGKPAREALALEGAGTDVADELGDQQIDDLLDGFLNVVPANVISAAAGEDLLGLVFFSLLFGFFMTRLDHSYADPMFRFWSGVSQVMTRMSGWVTVFAPVGVFALVAGAAGRIGPDAMVPVARFLGIVLVAMAGHALVILPALLRSLGRASPLALYRVAAPVVVTATATASALATLPMTMERVERAGGVSGRVASLVLPLGVSLNLNGTAVYNCAAAVFLAQAYGVNLDLHSQLTILAIGMVASVGVGSSPAASMLAIAVILSAIGVPAEAIGLLLVVDRPLDMARTGLNVLGDIACAVMVAQIDGEQTRVALDAPRGQAAA